MNDQRTGWKNTSPLLIVAFVVQLGFTISHAIARVMQDSDRMYDHVDRWRLAGSGVWVLFMVLMACGLFDLARRLTGRAAIAARISGSLCLLQLISETAWRLGFALSPGAHAEWIYQLNNYTYWALATSIVVAVAVAGWQRAPRRALALLAICLITQLPQVLNQKLFGALSLGTLGSWTLYSGISIVRTCALFGLVTGATDGVEAPRAELARKGFALAGSALTLRVIAAVATIFVTFIGAMGASRGSVGFLKLAMFAGLGINLISFAMFGIGGMQVARSALDGVPRYTAAVASAASLWCAGVMLEQLPRYYQIFYGNDSFGSSAQEELAALSIAMPVLFTVAGLAIATAIAGFGRARNDEILTSRAAPAGVWFTLLMLASMGIQRLTPGSLDSGIVILVLAGGCGLIALVVLSRICQAASLAISFDPSIPTAYARINDQP